MPFGMVQFGPDTTASPENAVAKTVGLPTTNSGRGYSWKSDQITGFSLTHLSGAGCPAYGDFPMLPFTGRLQTSPAKPGSNALSPRFRAGFSHSRESASPGAYSVRMHAPGGGAVSAQLAATTRTGFARLVFPKTKRASLLINAGGSGAGTSAASVQVHPGRREITGAASSGFFCAQRNRYRVYFAAKFDRRFSSYGTWQRGSLDAASRQSSDTVTPQPRNAAQSGAYATIDARRDRRVDVRVGISFVSPEGAEQNLRAESLHLGLRALRERARHAWNRDLSEIGVAGAPGQDVRTFYTDLYQAQLAPRTFSDADGRYPGMDGHVHRARGHTQYADFSGWDIYRTQIELLALLHPGRASDMVRSLVADQRQSGCLPKWPVANGQTMEMIGDPADQIISSAAAFGAGDFNHDAALTAMLKGATSACQSPNNGSYVERQGLSPYETRGFIPFEQNQQGNLVTSVFGSPQAVYGTASTTLEYAGADFAVAQFAARFAGNGQAYRRLMRRSANWKHLFDRGSGYLEPRLSDGSFPPGYGPTTGDGFAEGDSAQYTWSVPWNLGGLARRLGGVRRAQPRLGRFLAHLNATAHGAHSRHAYLGNEPSLLAPWIFDWLGRPYRTQEIVRHAIRRYWHARPAGYPGQNDLGETSAWYAMAALGFYPEIPGVGMLALDSPLFAHEVMRLPGGTVRVSSPGAAHGHAFIHGLRLNGHNYARPWLSFCALQHGARLYFDLRSRPDRRWGAGKRARPPSFAATARSPHRSCGP